VRIFRFIWDPAQQDEILRTLDANRVVDSIVGTLAGYRHPNLYVEVLNEIGQAQTARYIELLNLVVPRLKAAGLKVCGPSWATGDYEPEHWRMFRDAGWCGFDLIEPAEPPPQGDIDLAAFLRAVEGRAAILGDVQDQDLYTHDPEEIRGHIRAVRRVVGERPGYVCAPTCTPFQYPPSARYVENYIAFLEEAEALP